MDGITIATLGNFSASTGKPKSKKTFNVSAIVASALSGKEVLRYKATLPNEKHKVLYVRYRAEQMSLSQGTGADIDTGWNAH